MKVEASSLTSGQLLDYNGSDPSFVSIGSKPKGVPSSSTGKVKCIECDGYGCCCIPIPCVVMHKEKINTTDGYWL